MDSLRDRNHVLEREKKALCESLRRSSSQLVELENGHRDSISQLVMSDARVVPELTAKVLELQYEVMELQHREYVQAYKLVEQSKATEQLESLPEPSRDGLKQAQLRISSLTEERDAAMRIADRPRRVALVRSTKEGPEFKYAPDARITALVVSPPFEDPHPVIRTCMTLVLGW